MFCTTEQEWMASEDTWAVLARGWYQARRLSLKARRDRTRLVTAAVLRSESNRLPPLGLEAAVLLEQYATGHKRCSKRLDEIDAQFRRATNRSSVDSAIRHAIDRRCHPARLCYWAVRDMCRYSEEPTTQRVAVRTRDYIRCVFAHDWPRVEPFAMSADTQRLLAECVVGRDYSLTPYLADSCEEDGLDCPSLLNHLRTHPQHCFGCWALTLLRGIHDATD